MTLGLKFPVCLGQQIYQKCCSHLDQTIQTIFWEPPTHLKTIEFHFLLFPCPSTSKDKKVVVWAFIFWVCLPLMHPICIDPSESWVSFIQGPSLFHGKTHGLITKGNSSEGHWQFKNYNLTTPNFSSTISWLFCTDLVNVMLKTGTKICEFSFCSLSAPPISQPVPCPPLWGAISGRYHQYVHSGLTFSWNIPCLVQLLLYL